MKNILASQLVANMIETILRNGDGPIVTLNDNQPINALVPASFDNEDRCYFFTYEPDQEA